MNRTDSFSTSGAVSWADRIVRRSVIGAAVVVANLASVEPVRAEFDALAHYEGIFHDVFSDWVRIGARADLCGVATARAADVDAVVQRAAAVFRPGFFDWSGRAEFIDQLDRRAALARLDGMTEAQELGCFGIGMLVSVSSDVLDATLDAAEE